MCCEAGVKTVTQGSLVHTALSQVGEEAAGHQVPWVGCSPRGGHGGMEGVHSVEMTTTMGLRGWHEQKHEGLSKWLLCFSLPPFLN